MKFLKLEAAGGDRDVLQGIVQSLKSRYHIVFHAVRRTDFNVRVRQGWLRDK